MTHAARPVPAMSVNGPATAPTATVTTSTVTTAAAAAAAHTAAAVVEGTRS
jgi:hypothetical protein